MDDALVDALARDLEHSGYTGEGVRTLVGDSAFDALGRSVAAPARRALRANAEPRAALVRLLWLGDAVNEAELAEALPSLDTDALVRLGVAERRSETLSPRMTIRPYDFHDALGAGSWWVASDLDELSGIRPLRSDHVLGVGGAARTLAALLPPVQGARALDLGTGCGVIAMHLARLCSSVVATDISQRALWFAAFNLRLNAIEGVELRAGSLYEPVADDAFDLIASNPPFVITPRASGVTEYEYRDGGLAGDALMQAVVAGASAHLRPGGMARMLGNWEDSEAQPGLERAASWVGAGTSAWLIEREQLSAEAYAELWARDGGIAPHDAGFAPLLDAWLDDFAARSVRGIGLGWVLLEQRTDARVVRTERIRQVVRHDTLGAHLLDGSAAVHASALLSDAALNDMRFVVASDVTEARHQLPGAQGPNVIELHQGGGLARVIAVDTALAGLAGACDGELSIGVLIDAIASLLSVDAALLRADLLPRVRELWIAGVLSPID